MKDIAKGFCPCSQSKTAPNMTLLRCMIIIFPWKQKMPQMQSF
tara:strand:+ start:82 stop:210 length:129 start_codon:yes stop_codon:yes gene_type:complete